MPDKIDFASLPWETPLPGLRFKALVQGGKRMRLAEFSKDFREPDHCTKGHIGYVISGAMEIDFDDRAVHYEQGDGIYIPAGKQDRHKVRVISDKVVVFLVEEIS